MAEAFTQDLAARVTKLSRRQLEYWDATNVLRPSIAQHEVRGLPRLYSFTDLIKLKVAAEMRRRGILPSRIRLIVHELEERGFEEPLLSLRFLGDPTAGHEVFWVDPRMGAPLSARALDQTAETFDLTLRDLRTGLEGTIAQLMRRREGKVSRTRAVQGSRWVIEGTRVPVEKIQKLHADGWGTDRLLLAFPHLSERDIRAALRFISAISRSA